MTFSRARTAASKPRRPRRNRRRTAPVWQRLPELGARIGRINGRAAWTWLRRLLPGMVAATGAGLVVLGVIHGHGFLMTSSRFTVRAIEIRGNAALSPDAVQDIIGAQAGDNIFTLDLAAMTDALQAEPMVAHAQVRRQLPDTLLVEIQENEPAALVELDGLYLADDQGKVFKRAAIERGDGRGLPVITGLGRAEYNDDREGTEARIREALAAAALYEAEGDTQRRPALGEINVDLYHGITFMTYEHGMAVRVGHGTTTVLHERLHAFDMAWHALSDEERHQARIVYADTGTRPDRVTIGFEHIE